jgi:hypothetical protein
MSCSSESVFVRAVEWLDFSSVVAAGEFNVLETSF